MKRRWLLLVALLLPTLQSPGEESPSLTTTGSKTWTLADGGVRKMRFVEFGNRPEIAIFEWGAAPGGVRLDSLSAESRSFIDGIRDGRVRLLKTTGLSAAADFPAGVVRDMPCRRVGDEREWEHRNGRKIQAAVINLNDEVVSLLIGEKAWNLPIGDASESDQRYLEDLKHGRVRTVPLRVELGRHGWENAAGRDVSAKGCQVVGEPANEQRFEEALARALEIVGSRLDRKYWKFHELREVEVPKVKTIGWSFLSQPESNEVGDGTVFYQAVFRLDKPGRTKAAAIWPVSVTPPEWRGPPELVIDLAPNAQPATVSSPQS